MFIFNLCISFTDFILKYVKKTTTCRHWNSMGADKAYWQYASFRDFASVTFQLHYRASSVLSSLLLWYHLSSRVLGHVLHGHHMLMQMRKMKVWSGSTLLLGLMWAGCLFWLVVVYFIHHQDKHHLPGHLLRQFNSRGALKVRTSASLPK